MKYLVVLLSFFVLSSCSEEMNLEFPGAMVPPTADQDPSLPQLEISVAKHTRAVHLQTFGDPSDPAVFVLPGGPGADFRLLLPLKTLSDEFYVVMWDSRGAGLSERVTKEELSLDSFNEEIARIKKALAPGKKISLIGHSLGGVLVAHYTAIHPENVERLILVEPGKLDLGIEANYNGGAVNFLDGQDFFWQNEILTSSDHAAADYKAIEVLPKSTRNWTCDHTIIENSPMWRFGTYFYNIVQLNTWKLSNDYNWAAGIENFNGATTIIAGTCGAASKNFQEKTNRITLPQAAFKVIDGANHISLFTDYSDSTVVAIRSALKK